MSVVGCTVMFPFERRAGDAQDSSTTDDNQCGNGTIDPGESCEVPDLGGATCLSLCYEGGLLACEPDCQLDTGGCIGVGQCGNGVVEVALLEQCDGANLDGQTCESQGQVSTIYPGDQVNPQVHWPVIMWEDRSGTPTGAGVASIRYRMLTEEFPAPADPQPEFFADTYETLAHEILDTNEEAPAIAVIYLGGLMSHHVEQVNFGHP